jgi:hypothetical protein
VERKPRYAAHSTPANDLRRRAYAVTLWSSQATQALTWTLNGRIDV